MHAIYKNTSEIHIKLAPNAIRRARAGLFLGVSGAEFIGKTHSVHKSPLLVQTAMTVLVLTIYLLLIISYLFLV